ncbi:hypothetical protein EUTSA_v10028956mg [Eutrema salsugineum]|nr:hypothetical protein EUTSA_v10028956mg [Eutrema salsugineum]
MEELWAAFLLPPRGSLNLFCTVMMDHEDRFPAVFLKNFLQMFNSIRGSPPDDDLSDSLTKIIQETDVSETLRMIIKRSGEERSGQIVWNSKDDAAYEVPRKLMAKQFHHVKEQMRKRERERKQKKQKAALVEENVEEETPTTEEIEANKRMFRKQIEDSTKQYEEAQRGAFAETSFDRKLGKLIAYCKNHENRTKNIGKRE